MAQNIYDDEAFFAGDSQLPRSVDGLKGAPEWPSLRAQLPEIKGARIIDLGCGFGWFCRWAARRGAAEILGYDSSEKMLVRAEAMTNEPAITYQRADLERLALPPESCDLVYSSLALHYVADLERLVAEIARALVPGGALVFSVEHPIVTAPARPGWQKDADGRASWPVNGYLDEGPRVTDWLAPGVIKQHRGLGSYLSLLLRQGFNLTHVEEWSPSLAQIEAHPDWAKDRERPFFLLVSARRG